ncbi:MAG: alpha/beta hydrolase [Phycisphaerae bacterium]
MSVDERIEEAITIRRSDYVLEGRLVYPVATEPRWSCLIAGPHPLLGGELENNVVRALAAGFAAAGAAALHFNYSGVGRSTGGPGDWPASISAFWRDGTLPIEADWRADTQAAAGELARIGPAPLVLVGYSFGCWATAAIPDGPRVEAMILVSPNPSRHDFSALAETAVPLLVLHSDREVDCPPDAFRAWYAGLREPKTSVVIPSGEHFFRGHEDVVVTSCLGFLRARRVVCPEERSDGNT